MTCVAVIATSLLASCSSPSVKATPTVANPNPNRPSATLPGTSGYDITRQEPPGFDEWKYSGSSETEPVMHRAASIFGLDAVYVPKGAYADPTLFVGISKLERYCLVVFSVTKQRATSGKLNLVIISRYNNRLTLIVPEVPVAKVRGKLNSYRPMCRGDVPVPADMAPTGAPAGTVI